MTSASEERQKELDQCLRDLNDRVVRAERSIGRHEQEKGALERSVRDAQTRLYYRIGHLRQLLSIGLSLSGDLVEAIDDKDAKQKALQHTELQLVETQKVSMERASLLTVRIQEVEDLKQQIVELETALEEKKESLEQAVEDLASVGITATRVKELEAHIKELLEKVAQLSTANTELENKNCCLGIDYAAFQKESEADAQGRREEIDRLRRQIGEVEEHNQELITEKRELVKEIEAQKTAFAALQQSFEMGQEQHAKLQSRLEQEVERSIQLERDLKDTNNGEMLTQIQGLELVIENMKTEAKQQYETAAQLRAEIDRLTEENHQAALAIAGYENRIKVVEANAARAHEEKRVLGERLEESVHASNELLEERNMLRAENLRLNHVSVGELIRLFADLKLYVFAPVALANIPEHLQENVTSILGRLQVLQATKRGDLLFTKLLKRVSSVLKYVGDSRKFDETGFAAELKNLQRDLEKTLAGLKEAND